MSIAPLRIAHTGDWHVDEHSRFLETCMILDWFCSEVEKHRPDLVTVGGDSAPVSVRPMTPKERNTLADYYVRLAQTAPVIVAKGNHDCADGDVDIFSKLKSRHAIQVFSAPAIVQGASLGGRPFVLGALPWPSKGFLMSRAKQDGFKLDDVNEACREAIRAILVGIRHNFNEADATRAPGYPSPVKILLGHLNVTGCDVGGFALVGQDVEVGASDLEGTGADVVLLSHIHKRQSFGGRIHFPGSIRRIDFGEEVEEKGYLLIEATPFEPPVVQFHASPTRHMQTIRVVVDDDGQRIENGPVIAAADLRIIVEIDEHNRSSFDEQRFLAQMGASNADAFKIEYRVTPKQRVRAPEIQKAITDADRILAYLRSIEPAPDQTTIDNVLAKFALLSEVEVA